jgi:hypothetical protein
MSIALCNAKSQIQGQFEKPMGILLFETPPLLLNFFSCEIPIGYPQGIADRIF